MTPHPAPDADTEHARSSEAPPTHTATHTAAESAADHRNQSPSLGADRNQPASIGATGDQSLAERLTALEDQVSRLVAALGHGTIAPSSAPTAHTDQSASPAAPITAPAPATAPTSAASTTSAAAPAPDTSEDPAAPATPATTTPDTDAFWALRALQDRIPSPGGVVYTGSVDLPIGHLEYQWGRPVDPLLRADWAERADRLSALGHPLRLSMLRRLLEGEYTVAQLVDELDLASTGVAYHHLNLLQNAGWVTSPQRGTWAVPPTRVVPLLTIITAVEES